VEVGGYTDHVHLLFEMSRTQSIAQLVEHLKSGSSRWLKGEHQSLREFAWQSGYAVFSVGQSQRSRVQSYIQTQKDHHQTSSFQQEFRALLAGTMWCLTSATFGIDSGAHNRGGS
jgi:REP element-mobilizing transposase RayT